MQRDLDSSGRFIPPCHVSLSSCLDVSRIKSLWTNAIVGWDINALFLLCLGVECPVGVAIQLCVAAIGVAVGVTVICSGGFGIVYKCRTVAGSSSLDTVPVTGSLLFAASVCRLTVSHVAGFRWFVLIEYSDFSGLLYVERFGFFND